jgi:hypothetical protein
MGSILRETTAHALTCAMVGTTIDTILDNANKSCQRIPEVARIVSDLQRQSEAAGDEVARLEADAGGEPSSATQ